jgi:cytoskeletal protein RodZ
MSITTQPLSLGQILARAREEKGVSLEQAAHETKIRAAQLREMENDNTFHFSHSSYARFFLKDYAKYLGLSPSQIEEFLPETGEFSSEGMEYLNGYAKEEVTRAFSRLVTISPRRGSPLTAIAAVVFILLIASF